MTTKLNQNFSYFSNLAWIILFASYTNSNEEPPQWLNSLQQVTSGIIFLILVSILAWNGWRLSMLLRNDKNLIRVKINYQ